MFGAFVMLYVLQCFFRFSLFHAHRRLLTFLSVSCKQTRNKQRFTLSHSLRLRLSFVLCAICLPVSCVTLALFDRKRADDVLSFDVQLFSCEKEYNLYVGTSLHIIFGFCLMFMSDENILFFRFFFQNLSFWRVTVISMTCQLKIFTHTCNIAVDKDEKFTFTYAKGKCVGV